MALHRFRIDGIDSEPLVEEGADERAMRGLERDQDIVRRLSPRRTMFMNCSNPSAVCSIVPVDSTVPTSSIKYTCSLSAQSIPTNSTCSPPRCMRGHHARHHQQPSIAPAFETRLPIGGRLPRHPRGEIVLSGRSSRKVSTIFSPGEATRMIVWYVGQLVA